MPEVQVTSDLGKPVERVRVDLSNPSSLLKYLRTELFRLTVLPDFLERKDKTLTQAAPAPIRFQARVGHSFQLGNTKPEIDLTPGAQATIRVNASPGRNLFEDDPFPWAAIVPANTGYVSVGFRGSLDLGVSGSAGDLTFGFAANRTIDLGYSKAFALGPGEPSLAASLGDTLSSFVIPADLSDLDLLANGDIATASGYGSLKVSGGMSVTVSPNPLASVSLPLGAGAIGVKAGVTAGISGSFVISGSYQIRARRQDAGTIELSIVQAKGTALQTDLSASAGVTGKLGDRDLIASLLGAISSDPTRDQTLLADLRPDEAATLTTAIKAGLNHSLQGSLNLALTRVADGQAAFRYEIQPALLTAASSAAVHKALDGDLSLLTALEDGLEPDGALAPGIRMLNSVFAETRKIGSTLRLNLLGILNYVSMSELIRNSEILTDAVTGDVTIKEKVTGRSISAIVEPFQRDEALRKAIYDALLVTTAYRAGKAVSVPHLSCSQVHFALNQNTNHQIMDDYLGWLLALNLLPSHQERMDVLRGFLDGGPSTCVLRTTFDDAACCSLFFDPEGSLWTEEHYQDLGRQALRALLDPDHQAIDKIRYQVVDDANWREAVKIGANVNLGPLVGLGTGDVRVSYLVGDIYVITQWAAGMREAGEALRDIRNFVGSADPAKLTFNNEFTKRRETLQRKLAAMVAASKTRFDEPWGMVSLFWAAGSPQTAYGKVVTANLTLERGLPALSSQAQPGALAAAATAPRA